MSKPTEHITGYLTIEEKAALQDLAKSQQRSLANELRLIVRERLIKEGVLKHE